MKKVVVSFQWAIRYTVPNIVLNTRRHSVSVSCYCVTCSHNMSSEVLVTGLEHINASHSTQHPEHLYTCSGILAHMWWGCYPLDTSGVLLLHPEMLSWMQLWAENSRLGATGTTVWSTRKIHFTMGKSSNFFESPAHPCPFGSGEHARLPEQREGSMSPPTNGTNTQEWNSSKLLWVEIMPFESRVNWRLQKTF